MLVETLKREIKKEKEKARREGLAEGREEGKLKGIAEGKIEGERNGTIIALKTIAKEMLRENVDIENIKKWTKLTDIELQEIKKEMNNK